MKQKDNHQVTTKIFLSCLHKKGGSSIFFSGKELKAVTCFPHFRNKTIDENKQDWVKCGTNMIAQIGLLVH